MWNVITPWCVRRLHEHVVSAQMLMSFDVICVGAQCYIIIKNVLRDFLSSYIIRIKYYLYHPIHV